VAGRYRKVLVTGSTSGIGLEIGKQLLNQGYFVIFHGSGLNLASYEELKIKYPDQTDLWTFNLNKDPEVSLRSFLFSHGKIYGLVNNAGVIPDVNFFDCNYENLQDLFKVNTFAQFIISKVFLQNIDESVGGRIVNISSVAVKFGMGRSNTIQYAATKSSLEALTTGLAKVGASKNVLVNAIRPGCILTRIQKERKDFNERVSLIPLKRMGTESEIAGLVDYLLSDSASFVTGQVISVAGGE
jgi:3-oxoacyl-[acyl-carrier protein] reductase